MRLRLPFRSGLPSDPGERWADQVLGPLRQLRIEPDAAPAIMARVRAAALPAAGRTPRTAWTAAFAFGATSLVFLVASLAVLFATGDDGARALVRTSVALGRAALHLWERAVTVAFALLGATVPILRAVWEILEAAAPILETAGTAIAFCGFLAILYSSFVFARARRDAPQAGLHGGTR